MEASNYDQFDADGEQAEEQERKAEISCRANRAAAMRRKGRSDPMLIFIGTGQEFERMGRVRLTRRRRIDPNLVEKLRRRKAESESS